MSDEWKGLQIGDFCEVSAGGTPDTSIKEYWEDGTIPWMSSGEVHKQRIKETDSCITTLGLKNSSAKFFPKDSVLVALAGQGKTRGKVAISELELTTNQSIAAIIVAKDICDPEFLYYNLSSRYEELRSLSGGSGRAGLNLSILSAIEIHLPPVPEQKKIAEILSGTQGNLNSVAEEIAKLDNLEKCLLSSLFSENEGGEWKKVAVTDIGRVIRGASPRPKGDPRYYGGRVPRLMVADVTRDGKYVTPRIDFLTDAGAKLSRPVPAGTLTIVCSGVVGVPSILSVDACIHDGFLAIVDISSECNTEYLYYFFKPLQQIFDSSATHGGIFTNLTTEILKDFPVSLPSPTRQDEIVRILRSIDSLRNALLSKQSKLVCLFESISSDLLSGRKRVSI
ncbi:restriction endonuclease subunit S [Cyanobium sp. T1G-Tous]|uniref:restriction endonuclease subunit S n=1 Tax=Cyanobium sp. T1G-Tous TaxID=2823722 RepID=UPI0020CE6026|nr:restriction endonuclease subunit S [Cyanobium sp. T1G-Tous]MCP9803100.1 restriction endonuclease subunit S [Cyanobium sp. T1G-Tous]